MIEECYRNAFKEVYVILENTELTLLAKLPIELINFIKDNMNCDYKTHIQTNINIDKQSLLKETESILSLIYRSYWVTEEEKKKFAVTGQQEIIEKQQHFKSIEQIFKERKNINNITVGNDLMIMKKESFIKRFFSKVLSIFKK